MEKDSIAGIQLDCSWEIIKGFSIVFFSIINHPQGIVSRGKTRVDLNNFEENLFGIVEVFLFFLEKGQMIQGVNVIRLYF